IDANGIVHVTAKDLGTGKEQKIRIETNSGLSEDEINRMVRDAESHAEEDKRHKELAEVRNQADSLAYATERTLKEQGAALSDSEREQIEKSVAELRRLMEGDEVQAIRDGISAVERAVQPVASKLYSRQQSAGGPQGGAHSGAGGPTGGAGSSDSDEVEDADYEVVND
ncbi:MAG: Hsp70 family protein, partial [Alkalispirochaetaceae bacterium]